MRPYPKEVLGFPLLLDTYPTPLSEVVFGDV